MFAEGDLRTNIEAAFTQFPTLTTDRLRLRQIQPTDANALFAIRSDPEVTHPYGLEPHKSLDDTHALIQRLQTSYDRHDSIIWGITFKGEDTVIGSCCFWNFSSGFQCAELGYETNRCYWRKGITAEAVSAILLYGFTTLGLHRIEANPLARNTASRNLLLKLGFKYEGNLRQRVYFQGGFEDQHYFGLLENEWTKCV